MSLSYIDSHLHLDILIEKKPEAIYWYKDHNCGCITWCYVENIRSYKEYKNVWAKQKKICEEFLKELDVYYLVGIHPRSIPEDIKHDDLQQELKLWLKEHINHPKCLGMGELGLDSEENLEKEEIILRAQLEWASENLPANKIVGIHTSKINKEKMTEKTLKILQDYPKLKNRIIVDHTTPITWHWVKEEGYMCGVTLQEGKCNIEDLEKILSYNKAEDITVVNSDSGSSVSEYFIKFLTTYPLGKNITKKLSLDNPKSFFKIDKL